MYQPYIYISQINGNANKSKPSSNRGSAFENNGNNSWYFNGTNRVLNNNNRYNSNFSPRPVLDSIQYDNSLLSTYPIPLEEWVRINNQYAVGKRSKSAYIYFYTHAVDVLCSICHTVGNMEIEAYPEDSDVFVVTKPCVRMIIAAPYTRKLVHTLYVSTINYYLENFHYHEDSYACRKGRGTLAAVNMLQAYTSYVTNDYRDCDDVYYAKIDIRNFFGSIDCELLVRKLTEFIRTQCKNDPHVELLVYLTQIIYMERPQEHVRILAKPYEMELVPKNKNILLSEPYVSVPIGNWPSQMGGNFLTTFLLTYLSSLGYYFVHYTDDTAVIVRDKERWKEDIFRIEWFYRNELHLELHKDKRYLQHVSKGILFLGHKVRFNRMLPSDRIYHNMMWKISCHIRHAQKDKKYIRRNAEEFMMVANSYLAILRHCNAYHLRKQIIGMIADSEWSKVMDIDTERFEKITIKKEYTKRQKYINQYHQQRKIKIEELCTEN